MKQKLETDILILIQGNGRVVDFYFSYERR